MSENLKSSGAAQSEPKYACLYQSITNLQQVIVKLDDLIAEFQGIPISDNKQQEVEHLECNPQDLFNNGPTYLQAIKEKLFERIQTLSGMIL